LKGLLDHEKAAMGLYSCLEPPNKDILEEAGNAGFYRSERWPGGRRDPLWPHIQMRTIEDLLAGRGLEIPPRPVQFKQAAPVQAPTVTAPDLWSTSTSMGIDADANSDDADVDDE
jgi:hypothetical protein